MTDLAASIPSFPQHAPPQGIPIAHPKQSAILTKVLGRMLRPKPRARSRGRGKGLTSSQYVSIKARKVKWF
jgi:hypothetical protein